MKQKIFLLTALLLCSLAIDATERVPQYYCTAADSSYYPHLLNLIGSIHKTNYSNLGEILVFDLGLAAAEKTELQRIAKLSLHALEQVHPDILTPFVTATSGKKVPGWYAWKSVAIKQALDIVPHVLWVDSGTTVLKPLDDLFSYIKEHGYFLGTIGDGPVNGKCTHNVGWGATKHVRSMFNLESPTNEWALEEEIVMANVQGATREAADKFILPMYDFARDLRNFQDDGTTPNGFGTARHDQSLLSPLAYLQGLTVHKQDYQQKEPMHLTFNGNSINFYMTWHADYVNEKTAIYSSRWDLRNLHNNIAQIRLK